MKESEKTVQEVIEEIMAENFPEMVKSSSVRLIKQDKGKENPS